MSFPTKGADYDVAHTDIKCNADKEGAKVFDIDWLAIRVRVLAHSEQDAEDAARFYNEERLGIEPGCSS